VSLPTAHVDIVGLGPGGDEHVTVSTRALLDSHSHRFLRTARHPSAHLAGDAVSFDEVYDEAGTFADVYDAIVERLVTAARQHGRILYAVPGSPLVLERTVRLLLDDNRVTATAHPALSFLDIAYARLGIDPVETGITLIDGHTFATSAAGRTGAMLVAHTHANWVLSEIKLSVEGADDEPVVLLQALGTDHERIVTTTWAEMDRSIDADHLTSLYVPSLGVPVGAELVRFHDLARTLRQRCPWDQEQTHQSLVRYLIEETYEVVDAIQALDAEDPTTDDALIEELGDLLYQIEFHATIAEQEGRFTIADVARNVHDKLVRRHPHVFGDVTAPDASTVIDNWEAIKQAEKRRTSIFEGVPTSQPSLGYAEAIQRKAAKVGFDWPSVDGAAAKVNEELAEVLAAPDPASTAAEIGDLLFAVVNVARHLGVEPESALRAAVGTFRSRFEAVEALAAAAGKPLADHSLAELDTLWDQVKQAAVR
jgi:tetrapyrrole methylase family protein/MazG family protein